MDSDIASLALQSASALTTALALMFARFDAHRKRTSEPLDSRSRDALYILLTALWAWGTDAKMTDQAFQEWVDGHLDDGTAVDRLNRIPNRLQMQRRTSEQVLTMLRSDSPYAQDLRFFLKLYEPELLTLLDTALASRRELIDKLIAQMPSLRADGAEAMRATSNKLHDTSEQLNQAAERVRLYIRGTFPPGDLRAII